MNALLHNLKQYDYRTLTPNAKTHRRYRERLSQPFLVRTENQLSHFATYFVPFNPETKQVLLGHHKKAGLWLFPGGHIDPAELVLDTVLREIAEELGIVPDRQMVSGPFLATITDIDNPPQVCRCHFDLWHLFKTDGSGFQVDQREYYDSAWLSLEDARCRVTDPNNLLAIDHLSALR